MRQPLLSPPPPPSPSTLPVPHHLRQPGPLPFIPIHSVPGARGASLSVSNPGYKALSPSSESGAEPNDQSPSPSSSSNESSSSTNYSNPNHVPPPRRKSFLPNQYHTYHSNPCLTQPSSLSARVRHPVPPLFIPSSSSISQGVHTPRVHLPPTLALTPILVSPSDHKIKKVPSTPTFKNSASVIYEEEEDEHSAIHIDCSRNIYGDLMPPKRNVLPGKVGDSPEIYGYSTGSGQSSPPKYFELNQLPSFPDGTRRPRRFRSYMREESLYDVENATSRAPLNRGMSTATTVSNDEGSNRYDAWDGLSFILSAIYAKLLVIIGLCFPMAEVISHRIPIGWYEGFYLYLYLGSVLFLIILYSLRQGDKRKESTKVKKNWFKKMKGWLCWGTPDEPDSVGVEPMPSSASVTEVSVLNMDTTSAHFGSFYLRLGAVAFGIGSLIYSGLEFGQFFELESKEHCYSFLYGFTPSSHMVFTFFQLYFVFMNSKVLISKHKYFARFGLMHMIGTNLCVWLHVLIQETKHQIIMVVNATQGSDVESVVEDLSEDYLDTFDNVDATHTVNKRSLVDHESTMTHGQCRRTNVIGQLVQDASQFLFPCTIEYSLICAAVLYMMWKHTSKISRNQSNPRLGRSGTGASTSTVNQHHPKHHYQVDCAKAHKGLFCGIFLLVVCIISLILFFVLIKKPNYRHIGVLQAHIVELIVYVINCVACIIAGFQIQKLRYSIHRNVELDNILLIVAQTGLTIFNMFSLIGAQFFDNAKNTQLVLINAIACIVQATLQTTFILDASKRYCHNSEQTRRKPGREMVTFMLVCNFAMWAINTLETRRADSNPVQMHFYGFWAWTIITHVTTPLTIFYRFHSTVCLCDIWKRVYKLKIDYQ